MEPQWDPPEFRGTPALENEEELDRGSVTHSPCGLGQIPVPPPLLPCKLPLSSNLKESCDVTAFRTAVPPSPIRVPKLAPRPAGRGKRRLSRDRGRAGVSVATSARERAARPSKGSSSLAGEGQGRLGGRIRGSASVWDKGPLCSRETHVSNWILAATLRKWLFGKRKSISGFRDCYKPRGPFIGPRPALARMLAGVASALRAPPSPEASAVVLRAGTVGTPIPRPVSDTPKQNRGGGPRICIPNELLSGSDTPAAMSGPRGSQSPSDSPPGHCSGLTRTPHAQDGPLSEVLRPLLFLSLRSYLTL